MSPKSRSQEPPETVRRSAWLSGDEGQLASRRLSLRKSRKANRRRILLAEDDADMRELLSWVLLESGYEVDAVRDGIQLCRRLADHLIHPDHDRIDLVVSDIRMPGVTGMEVIRGLRELDHLPPVILITAFGDEETHHQAREIGLQLLDKPFEIDELLSAVRKLLRHD